MFYFLCKGLTHPWIALFISVLDFNATFKVLVFCLLPIYKYILLIHYTLFCFAVF